MDKRELWRNNIFILSIALVVAWLLNACLSSTLPPEAELVEPTATPTPEPTGRGAGDTLRLLYWGAPEILNPHLTGADKELEVSRITYEPLASFDKDGNLVPFLAAEIPSQENGGLAADGKSVTWKLKPGVKWSDGQPFTAADVRFTYEFIKNPEVKSPSTSFYESVASVEVIDDNTVKVNFKQVTPAWAVPFVGLSGVIIPRHVFEAYNGANARQAPANTMPVGTGPYRIVPPGIKPQEVLFIGNSLIQTIKIVYEPNPYFREADKPFFSRIELRGGGVENEAARAVLRAGEVDYAYNLQIDPQKLTELAAAGKGHVVSIFGSGVEQVALNRTDPNRATADGELSSLEFEHPIFSDKRVRQALAYAIDREAIAKLYGSTGRLTSNNLVAPANYDSPNVFYEFDPDKAKALLEEADWVDTDGDGIREKDGKRLKIVSKTFINSLLEQTQEIIRRNLRAIGVDVDTRLLDSKDYLSDPTTNSNSLFRFPADLQEYSISTTSPDPATFMDFWTCKQIPQKNNNWSGLNIGRWCNPQFDTLLQQATTELDPEKRQQLFIQMNDVQVEDVAMIPLVQLAQVFGVNNTIEGVDPTPWDGNLWNLKDWRRTSP